MRVEWLRTIEKVASKIAPGRTPTLTEVHVVKALQTIGAGTVGRIKLSEILGLSGGTTRTLVWHLRKEELIEVSRSGMTLSKFGEKVFSHLKSRISREMEIPESPLTVGPFNMAVLVRNVASLVKNGLEQRDAAIKVGASGATTLVFNRNKLTIPGVGVDLSQNIKTTRNTLISKLKPRDGDVIIIGSANEKRSAELGAKAAAFELLKTEESLSN